VYLCSQHADKPPYLPGLERWSAYKTLWLRHWPGFRAAYNEGFKNRYGPLTAEKITEVEKLLRCGKFGNGFQRHTCTHCGTVLVVPFTCKSRLCLSCYRKKLFGWSINLSLILNTNLDHLHVTFTVPGAISRLLLEKKYDPAGMITEAANCYRGILMRAAGVTGKEYAPGIIATIHRCGNALNYNPHVHLIGTSELVNTETGEIIENGFLPFKLARFVWMRHFLNHLVKSGVITGDERDNFINRYGNGFHVYFKPVKGDDNEILFKAAEYIASGYMHNSQIVSVDNQKMTVTFRYKSWVNRSSGEKTYAAATMDIYDFMARMLYYLPEKAAKTIRYYGIYARHIDEKLAYIEKKTWREAVKRSFDKDPVQCPECGREMIGDVVYSFQAKDAVDRLIKTHYLKKGYFRPRKPP